MKYNKMTKIHKKETKNADSRQKTQERNKKSRQEHGGADLFSGPWVLV
jgi:hypothetical protein